MTDNTDIKKINDAWLGLDIPEKDIFNPALMLKPNDPKFHLRLIWLMTRPEYFSLICKIVIGADLLPSQSLMLKEMWDRKFPMLIASRGFGKSWILSVYSILRALLLPNRQIVIVGAAFRQSKVLFAYMETIWDNSPILRSMCDSGSGPRRSNDQHVMRINGSTITCLPLGDGSKIRGQRANDIIADEFACLEAGSIVETYDGLVRIEDFDYHRIITGDYKNPVEFPEKFIKTPLTDVYEIKLTNGYVIRASKDHKVMTNNGWKKPLDLSKDDYIEQSNQILQFGEGVNGLDEKLAWLMGILVSEGCITDKKRISITTTDKGVCSRLINQYGFKMNFRDGYTDKRGWNCNLAFVLWLDDEDLRSQLYDYGLDYVTAHDKKIPHAILKSPEEVIRHFLSGLFNGDGSCFLWQDRDIDNRIGLAYYSVSERLCRDVQFLMYKLGFDGYINNRDSKISDNKQWFVRWNNRSAKHAAIYLSVPRFKEPIDNCSIPEEPTNYCWDKDRKKWKVSIVYLGKTIQKRFKHESQAKEFISDIKNRKQYRQVVSVNKMDKQQNLYDYYLPKTHSFYAEGHRQHNSIPRDIFETVVAGFGVVTSAPVENVQKMAAMKMAAELGIELEDDEDVGLTNKKSNQIILSGTAYYDFNHFADYWKKWRKIIQSGGDNNKLRELFGGEDPPKNFDWKQYSVIRIPYELLPEGFMDASQVARSKATVHVGTYQMEYGAVFTRDSQGFFKRSLIESCVSHDKKEEPPLKDSEGNPIIFSASLLGSKKKQHIFGVDPASEVDNFSIVVLEINPCHRRIVYCWTINRSEHREKVKSGESKETDFYSFCGRKIRNLMRKFPCIHIAMDAGGGGIAVEETLHDKDKMEEGEQPLWPIIEEDKPKDSDDMKGLHILEMCQFSQYEWLRDANHGMRKDFEDKILLFPMFDSVLMGLANIEDEVKGRKYDTLEECVLEIEELKDELAMIEISQTPSGRERWDTPEMAVAAGKKERIRKDRYSALMMANKAARDLDKINPVLDVGFFGGFATTEEIKNPTGKLFNGPAWFEDGMKGVY